MTIHRPTFGRKAAAFGKRSAPSVAAHEVANDAPAKRILPEELWDGPAGDTLRELGLNPDDPANHKPTQADADAKQNEAIALQQAFLANINSQLPEGTDVVAYAMLPWELWNGEFGHMLAINCGLQPTQPWNTMLLASDQRSSVVLDLPEHPGGYPGGLIGELERMLGELRESMDAEMSKAKASGEISWDRIMSWDQAREAMIPNIIALSHHIGQLCIGEEAFARHRLMFGATLGWAGAE